MSGGEAGESCRGTSEHCLVLIVVYILLGVQIDDQAARSCISFGRLAHSC